MAWPLTGSALTKYNRLLSDLRQYGDFIFVGAPDDITWLQETIIAASDGALRPSLDDVANRSHYWMLELSRVLGEKVVVCPECPECPPVIPCPPCPPCPPLDGIDWGPDNTTFDASSSGVLDLSNLSRGVTSLILRSLETVTGGDLTSNSSTSLESFSAPELLSVGGGVSFSGNSALTSLDLPKLATVNATFTFEIANNAVLTSFSLPALTTVNNNVFFTIHDNPALTSISLPVFTTMDDSTMTVNSNPLLVTVSLPAFTTMDNNSFVEFIDHSALTSFSLPALATVDNGSALEITNSPVLATVSLGSVIIGDGTVLDFSGNALTDTSVNHLLARGVASALYVSGTIDTSGGTSSAPTGQGIADKATLIARGVTVTTN